MQGLDIETTALDPEAGKVHLVQIRNGRHGRVYDGHDPELPAALRKLDKAVAHNATFERSWIAHHYGLDLEDLDDTMIMSQVLYTGTNAARAKQFSHSLQAVVKRELKRELDKSEQDGEWADEDLTPEQIRYAARDAHVLPDLAETLMGKIERAGLRDVYELERRVSHVVAAMERYGVAIHTDRLEAMIEEATQKAETLKAELAEEWTINPGSSKQLIEHFGLDERADWPKTDKGAPSTNQEAMKGLLAEEESVAKWLEWKEVEKIRSTYGESLRKRLTPAGRIHARFNPFGTATGRFSSSGPNLQNIPKRGEFGKRMRGLFWSGSDDRVLIKADYASIELWLAAVRWEDPYMQKALQQGVNMHVATAAAALFNVKPGEALRSKNSQTHNERFPGLDQALEAPLRYAE